MNTTRGNISVVALGFVLAATVTHAGVPDGRYSIVETPLVGNSTGTPTLTARPGDIPGFEVTLRDINNAPIPGVAVGLGFSQTPNIRLYAAQTAGTTVDCATRRISRITDAQVKVLFAARFGGFDNANSVEVDSAGINIITRVPARSTDIDGVGGGTDASDSNRFRAALFGAFVPECDFTADGLVNAADLMLFKNELFAGGGNSYCP